LKQSFSSPACVELHFRPRSTDDCNVTGPDDSVLQITLTTLLFVLLHFNCSGYQATHISVRLALR